MQFYRGLSESGGDFDGRRFVVDVYGDVLIWFEDLLIK
jgi:hypothetical protein